MLNSAEHEILKANKYENIKKFIIFQAQKRLECYFFMLKNISTFMSKKNFMLSQVEPEFIFIMSGLDLGPVD